WVQQHVRTLYSAKTQQAFDAAFDTFVSQDARITLNGKHLSREDYKNTIRGEVQGETGATVTFKDVVAVPAPKTKNPVRLHRVGTVGAFFTAELFQRFIVFGARQSNIVTSSLNV
ncbi:uncharacterized protein BXZ73DRAFT_34538, partial [Epithele typhae]|uniref:uncharacterized protein n=1 Tax=Epithele typhae TaxID=378194 RepID=UPI002007A224